MALSFVVMAPGLRVKAPSPAFSLYPKDIFADEFCQAMKHAEFGMYIRLLCHCWLEGSIPSDPIRLQRILKVGHKTFASCWPAIAPCFTAQGDRLIQSRLELERAKQMSRSLQNAERGRKGGRPLESTKEKSRDLAASLPDKSLPSPSPSPYNGTWKTKESILETAYRLGEPPMPNPTPVPEWEAQAKAVWSMHLGGENDYIYADLIPVVRRFGPAKTLIAWEAYCKAQAQNQGGKFASARSFAAKPAPWIQKEPEKVVYHTRERLLASQQ